MVEPVPPSDGPALARAALDGDRRSLARLLTLVENGDPVGQEALAALYPRSGQAHVVGITGSPGAGKSTLVNRLAKAWRSRDVNLAIVAVDPTSPFTGGAFLGDRLRMRDLVEDPGIFIRSMASRGHPGGIAHATRDLVTVLDSVGIPLILVETVGAGQAQVDVARVAHTVVLVEAPGMGDDVQAIKAGLMEIADLIVVNKADKPEAQQTLRALLSVHRTETETSRPTSAEGRTGSGWVVPILQTSALDGTGIEALIEAILAHRAYLEDSGLWHELLARRAEAELQAWLERHLQALVRRHLGAEQIADAVQRVLLRERDPASAAADLVQAVVEHLRD